jgi:glycosyltransferase involved in cell wall biosynthesis
MEKKVNFGLIFPDDSKWTGGRNYFFSLITALKFLKKKINFTVIASFKTKEILLKHKINYQNIYATNFFKNNHILNFLRKIILFIFGKDLILNSIIKKKKLKIFSHYKPLNYINSICWIPDLQHKYLKTNFTNQEIKRRNILFKNYIKFANIILVSSLDSKKKLLKNYKNINKNKIEILRFVPTLNLDGLKNFNRKKYNLNSEYLYTPNQFWPHKNHEILIKCANELKKRNYYIQFVLSGDNSINKEYFEHFIQKIKKLNLTKYFNYVGMIPNKDVSKLIFNSKAVINPSLFEGWNTGVEEAKILKKKTLLSDIMVHREQASKNSFFFKKKNHKQLTKIIINLKKDKRINILKIKKDYILSRKKFAFGYLNILLKSKV